MVALGLETPWYVGGTHFEAASKTLMIRVDFHYGSRFSHPRVSGEHRVYDTQRKRYVVRRMLIQWRANLHALDSPGHERCRTDDSNPS